MRIFRSKERELNSNLEEIRKGIEQVEASIRNTLENNPELLVATLRDWPLTFPPRRIAEEVERKQKEEE